MSLQYLVDDIDTLLSKLEAGEHVDIPEELYEEFGKVCADSLRRQMRPQVTPSRGTVRMSNLGRPDRILYYEVNHPEEKEKLESHARIRFAYGDMIEALVLFLMEASGNAIDNKQARIQIKSSAGNTGTTIKGSCDGSSRGTVFDIKSASSYAYNTKFAKGGLELDDPFGYRFQLGAYKAGELKKKSVLNNADDIESVESIRDGGIINLPWDISSGHSDTRQPAFVVIDKSDGRLKITEPSIPSTLEVKERIEHVMRVLDEPTPPTRCHAPIPKGNKGNMILPKPCGWCDFKQFCHKDANDGAGLRTFEYSTYKGKEPTYFTKVVDEPRVKEITNDT